MSEIEFGEILARMRLERGISQEVLAERASLSVDAVSALERGLRRTPRVRTITALADALNLTDDERELFAKSIDAARRTRQETFLARVPASLTTFVGREQELAEVERLLGKARLVTITGPGGIGKTRLALQIAGELEKDGEIAFVDLSNVTPDDLLVRHLGAAIGLPASSAADRDAVIAALRSRNVTIVLDNCDHVLDAASTIVADIVRNCSLVKFIATSRQPLALRGEQIYKLQPLAAADAVTLFVERAALHDPRFELDAASLDAAHRICDRLDRMPLAIELAAPRLQLLSIDQLERRLSDRFQLLAGLRAAIDWSYSLLDEHERRVFARLSLFTGSFSYEAAEAVCSDDDAQDLLDVFECLVDKSLVGVAVADRDLRLQLLESLRQYAAEKLCERGDVTATQARYIEYYIAFARASRAEYDRIRSTHEWNARMGPEIENVRAALRMALTHPEHLANGVKLFSIISDLWGIHGLAGEAMKLAEQAEPHIETLSAPARAEFFLTFARLQWALLLPASALEASQRACALYEQLENPLQLGRALLVAGEVHTRLRNYAEALNYLRRGADLFAQGVDKRELARTNLAIATVFQSDNRLPEAKHAMLEALALMRELGDERRVRIAQTRLAETEFALGEIDGAIERARANLRSGGMNQDEALRRCQQSNLACYLLAIGARDEARTLALEALQGAVANAQHIDAAVALQHYAAMIASERRELAAQFLGYANHTFEKAGYVREPAEHYSHTVLLQELERVLDEPALRALVARGALLSEAQAFELATNALR